MRIVGEAGSKCFPSFRPSSRELKHRIESNESIESMLQHPGFDPNGSDPRFSRPYLRRAASYFQLKAADYDQKLKIAKFQCLLDDAGADPELGALEGVYVP